MKEKGQEEKAANSFQMRHQQTNQIERILWQLVVATVSMLQIVVAVVVSRIKIIG